MANFSKKLVPAIFSVLVCSSAAAENHITQNAENIFLPENAILDTSIPFAIGAREAIQELRGAYGWDTFQEGLVEGVYFRFDPDGYARFSPNARLDSDLFEVICRPRTLNCLARKGPLTIVINGQGQLKLEMEGIATGDQYFVADTLSEFELPDRIWQPLDARFENVLAVGGELVVRRGQNEVARISLTGFSAVTSYLRWILAEQDYLALPRNWPVPNSTTSRPTTNLTSVQTWRDVPAQQDVTLVDAMSQPDGQAEMQESTDELAALRELVEQMAVQQTNLTAEMSGSEEDMPMPNNPGEAHEMEQATAIANASTVFADIEFQLAKTQAQMLVLESRIFDLEESVKSAALPVQNAIPETNEMAETTATETTEMVDFADPTPESHLVNIAEKIEQISSEFGIDPSVAMLLLQLQNQDLATGEAQTIALDQIEDLFSATTVAQASTEAEGHAPDVALVTTMAETSDEMQHAEVENAEFSLLTDYFQSVVNE